MCRDRCWKTLHASQIEVRPEWVRRILPCGRALVFRVCTLQCVVWMPGRGRFGGKSWTRRRERAAILVFLRTPISTIKMQSEARFIEAFICCSAIRSYVRTAFRNLCAAALRSVRDRYGSDRKAATDRTPPARVRIQVRFLQPDHIGRAGAEGRSASPPLGLGAAAAALGRFPAKWKPVRVKKTRQLKNPEPRSDSIGTEEAPVKIDSPQKRGLPTRRTGFLPGHAACKASAKLHAKKRQGHVRGFH